MITVFIAAHIGGYEMALIPQAKCSRCDRKYSGLRTKCPYCGARRYIKSNRAVPNDNSMWKVIVGILLLVVLIVAVIVLIATSGNTDSKQPDDSKPSEGQETKVDVQDADPTKQQSGEPDDSGSNPLIPGEPSTPDNPSTEEPTKPEEPVETPQVKPQSVVIVNASSGKRAGVYNKDLDMYEFSLNRGDKFALDYKVTPDGVTDTAVWETSNESVVSVLQSGEVTAVSAGRAYITVTIGGVSNQILVRVRNS